MHVDSNGANICTCMSDLKDNYMYVEYDCINTFYLTEIGDHLTAHGDGVKDVAFSVEDLDAIFEVGALKTIHTDYI
jgi:hypothetical protein